MSLDIYDYLEKQKTIYKPDKKISEYVQQYVGDIDLLEQIINPENNYYTQIYVDTDCDGQSSGLILKEVFEQQCVPYNIWVSNRADGYGLVKTKLDQLMQSLKLSIKRNETIEGDVSYIIKDEYITNEYPKFVLFTADLGITNFEEVDYAYEIGFDKVIITDHHTVENTIPKADLVINPKLGDIESDYVCGAGVVYLAYKEYRNQFMDIIAGIATIGDMVDLSYGTINRSLVKIALHTLNRATIENDKLRYFLSKSIYNFGRRKITETDFGFSVCPMINSISRMGKPELIQQYFDINNSKDKETFEEIKALNSLRKHKQQEGEETIDGIKESIEHNKINIFVLDNIPSGVIGLVSSYALNKYDVDNMCIVNSSGDSYKGSGRSQYVNIYESLKPISESIEGIRIGGHSHALGGSFKNKEVLQDFICEVSKLDRYEKIRNISVYDLDIEDLSELNKIMEFYAPYGMGNKPPLFRICGKIHKTKEKNGHLFLEIVVPNDKMFGDNVINATYFKCRDNCSNYKKDMNVVVIGSYSDNGLIVENIEILK